MKLFRLLLFPISVIYGSITSLRNFLFDNGILKSYQFDLPIICVGNLNVGGTGKTPQIEYLIRLLSNKYKLATLSRGYKRETKGFFLANDSSNAQILGDEPFQFFSKFKNIIVAVDEDRKNGVENLLSLKNKPEIILLDDAFQHRKIKAGFYILLTTYNDLFCDDYILPTGNLRESEKNSNRANLIIVTKCPKNLDIDKQNKIKSRLKLNNNQHLFFSFIEYDDKVLSEKDSIKIDKVLQNDKLLVAGIANPKPFFDYLKQKNDSVLEFKDHHEFTNNDIQKIKELSLNKIIVTTEKDYVRLKNRSIPNLYYLPIKSSFLNDVDIFNEIILSYISTYI